MKGEFMGQLPLDLHDIQGDVLEGLPKTLENFIFFRIVDPVVFKQHLGQYGVPRITSALQVNSRRLAVRSSELLGFNLGFTNDGLGKLISVPSQLDLAFAKGADHRDTIEKLNDPPRSNWLNAFISDRI